MSIEALLALRDKVGTALAEKTAEIRKQIQRLDFGTPAGRKSAGGRSGSRKIAPKYRDPDDPENVWAGRGAVPRWMAAKIKTGAKRDDFLIGASGSPTRKRRTAKATLRAAKAARRLAKTKRAGKAAKRPTKMARRPKVTTRRKTQAASADRRNAPPAAPVAGNGTASTPPTE
jgi:DNA-binding protein H-NS